MANFKEKMKRKRKWQARKQKLQIKIDNILRIVYRKITNNLKDNQWIIQFCLNCIAHRAARKVMAKLKSFAVIEDAELYEIAFEWGENNELDMRLEEPLLWYNICREKILGKHINLPKKQLQNLVHQKMIQEGFSCKEYKNKELWTLDLR